VSCYCDFYFYFYFCIPWDLYSSQCWCIFFFFCLTFSLKKKINPILYTQDKL
jgi:hypothetical protein